MVDIVRQRAIGRAPSRSITVTLMATTRQVQRVGQASESSPNHQHPSHARTSHTTRPSRADRWAGHAKSRTASIAPATMQLTTIGNLALAAAT